MYLLNRNGIYYYQRVTMCNGRRQTLRKSLKTRDRAKAQLLALQIHFNHSSPVQQAACISDAACRDVMSKPVGFEAEASTTQLNRPYFPRHLKSLKLRSFRRCYEQAATLHGRIQTGRRQAGD